MRPEAKVTDLRLHALLQFYRRHWPGGELARMLEELQERRMKDQEQDKGRAVQNLLKKEAQ